MGLRSALVVLVSVVVAGCQSWAPVSGTPPRETAMAQLSQDVAEHRAAEMATPDAQVLEALLPPLDVTRGGPEAEARFDIAVNGLAAREFFMGLVQGTDYNMVVSEGIGGTLSLDLKNVTVEEVMEMVRDVYGYEYKRRGNLFSVVPARLETALFHINYLNVSRDGSSDVRVSAGTVADSDDSNRSAVVGTRINTRNATDFWGRLEATLRTLIGSGEGRNVVITPQAGVVAVRAMPSELQTVRAYLEQAELTLQRQVILEAKILEVELSNGFQSGINWNAVIDAGSDGETLVLSQSSAVLNNPDNIAGVFGAALNLTDFSGLIQLLETQGEVQVLSSPRVSTLNNQKAVIKVGTDEFFVTDIETTTTTGTATTTTPDVELTPFFSGIALDVTPQISGEGEIILHVHPSISEVTDQQKTVTVGADTLQLPLALSTIRESDSVVRASSGQVIVIGGLMKSAVKDTRAKTPGMGDIAGIGALFRQKRQASLKSELVILLKPTIAGSRGWQRSLQQSLDNFTQLRRADEPGRVE
ncbi:pilus (MSHA type) biogenesis protein MshL [Motiliproteus sp. SC1-56]|uniref:pilus (MSHA type) biogenesis protein MshL n=1 Tax=Motiliproteus sp. SC1-56 TaxID=2799565 RepID=UPI001A8F157B|nr:pilus (MSHA type) biogenesis protein MshL [Motiliproteus sp. SC1-56]